jgi:hypothetical protein
MVGSEQRAHVLAQMVERPAIQQGVRATTHLPVTDLKEIR